MLSVVVCVVMLCAPAAASADEWFPDPANATWQYLWSDSAYNPSGTVENVVVQQQQGVQFHARLGRSAGPAAGGRRHVHPLFG